MKSITLLELRQHPANILREVARGRSMVLKYRGKPAARLEPLPKDAAVAPGDPFYSLNEIAVPGGDALSNEEIDRVVYGA
jgi:antitoxin (DNA-binding transcriptional repressor) of toxin-antitoxin stability system